MNFDWRKELDRDNQRCPYLVSNGICEAERIIISALAGKNKEGQNIFYPTESGNCQEEFQKCDTFRYAKELR